MALATHIPKEIDEYESKIIGPFTARQLVCGSIAVGMGLGIYALLHFVFGWSAVDCSYIIMLCAAIPGSIGFIKPDGMVMEQYMQMRLHHWQSGRPKIFMTKEEKPNVSATKGKGRRADRAETGDYHVSSRKGRRKAGKAARRHIRSAKKELRRCRRKAKKAPHPQERP